MKITKNGTFESAHLLKGHPKCGKLHGHSYRYEVTIEGEPIGKWDFVLDFHEIKAYFDKFDHSGVVLEKSAEILAKEAGDYFWSIGTYQSVVIKLYETATSCVEYERRGN